MAKAISAEEFDRKFDAGEDISEFIDWNSAERINDPDRTVISLPREMRDRIDAQAVQSGTTRQALILTWLADRLDAGR